MSLTVLRNYSPFKLDLFTNFGFLNWIKSRRNWHKWWNIVEDCSQGDLYGDKKEICETEPVKAKAERSLTSVGALTFTHISKSWKHIWQSLKKKSKTVKKIINDLKGIVYKPDLPMPCEGIMRRRMIIHLLPIMSGTWSDCRNTRVFSSKLHHLEVILKNAQLLPTSFWKKLV